MRSEKNYIYYDFIHYFVSAVIGKMDYKKRLCSSLLSTYATVSDEAFAILSLENNYDTWMDMALTGNTKTSSVPCKYTNGGKSKGTVATSQHNKGWSDEGLCRFNELFDLVEKNRATPFAKQFEEDFCQWCETKASGKCKKVEKLYTESVQVCHELWSDDEDEADANVNPYSATGHKRLKAGDTTGSYQFDVTNQLGNEILPTPSGYDNNEESKDKSAAPIPDKSVFHKA